MARIKRQRNARSHQRLKRRSHNLSIPELIYKFLVEENAAAHDAKRVAAVKCRCCGYEGLHEDEIADSSSTPSTGRSMGYRTHKTTGRVTKARGAKRCRTSRDLISYLQKCVGVEDTRKARKYMKKALNFGIESGYLIPSDPTYKILRVSSDLMKSDSQKSNTSTCDKTVSKERETPNKLEDLQVQEQRRRRRRRGRRSRSRRSRSPPRRGRRRSRRGRRRRRRRGRRSRSRTRSRSTGGRSRYSSPQNPEEVAEEMADDYEMDEDDTKGNIHTDGIDREANSNRPKQSDEEQSKKTEENDSDFSVNEDEESDEEAKKRVDTTES